MRDPVTAEGVEPSRVLAIASVPRSGSTLLTRALGSSGVAGRPEEYLGSVMLRASKLEVGLPRLSLRGWLGCARRRLRGAWGWEQSYRYTRRSTQAYLRQIVTPAATTPNGVLGIKIHWIQYHWTMHRHGMDVGWWRVPVTWVLLTRDDHLRQACSLVRARQTGRWEAELQAQPREAGPRYDAGLLRAAIDELVLQEQMWENHFAARAVEPLHITYEQLTTDHEGTVRTVLTRLGVDAPEITPPRVARQADELTEEWVRRFAAGSD